MPQVGPWGACRWRSGPIYHPKVDQDGHGQHGHGRILINAAAKQQNPTSCRGYFFWRPAMDRPPGALSIATFEKNIHCAGLVESPSGGAQPQGTSGGAGGAATQRHRWRLSVRCFTYSHSQPTLKTRGSYTAIACALVAPIRFYNYNAN